MPRAALPSWLTRAAPLLAAAVVALWLGRWDFVPPGPGAADPGFGAGSDWDIQWEMAAVARAAMADGALPHWDPYPTFGVPLLANPESFVLHPAWLIGAAVSTRAGFRALWIGQALLLMLGAAWLGRRLRVPWWLAMACALPVLTGAECRDRLYNGHLMYLGVAAWPACLAAVLAAVDRDRRGRRWSTLALGGVGGAALGLAALGGGHYAMAFGLLAALLLTWAAAAPVGSQLLLVGVMGVPLLLPGAPPGGRFLLVGAGAGALALGLWRSGRRAQQLWCAVGLAVGLVATAGVKLLPAAQVLAASARRDGLSLAPPPLLPLPLDLPWSAPERVLEGYLYFGSPWLLAALLIGLVALARVSRPLATVGAALLLLAWSSGRPLQPWELVAWSPGMSAINSPLRLQWVLPLLGPLGLAAALLATLRDRLGPRAGVALAAALALAAAWLFAPPGSPPFGGPRPDRDVLADPHPAAIGAADPELYLSRAAMGARVHPGYGTALAFPPLTAPADDALAIAETGCGRAAADTAVTATPSLDGWDLTAPAGTELAVRQRDVSGWRCAGAEIVDRGCVDGPEGEQAPGRGGRWLRIRIGDEGRARCRWRSPGLWLGAVGQAAALALLGTAFAVGRRRG